MLRRWAVGLVLVAAVGLGVYAWRSRDVSVPLRARRLRA